MATAQLKLIETERSWKLDRRTVEIGRAGLAQARAALAAATSSTDEELTSSIDTHRVAA